jgi:predicted nucleotidyltransferase
MRNVTAEVLNEAVETAREYGATELILFGSALDPAATPRDIDLACRGVLGWKIFNFGAALEDRLDMPVDLVPLDKPSRFGRWIEAHGRRLL